MDEQLIEKKLEILLVEDDEIDVQNVRRSFKRNNISHALQVASDGIDALEFLRRRQAERESIPKVILLDINMPRMNGIEFMEAVRADPTLRSIAIFVLTTSNEDKDRIAAYNFNVAGYILKPISFERFVEAIKVLNDYWQLIELPH